MSPAGNQSPDMLESRTENSIDWRSAAACRHVDPEMFFPSSSSEASLDQIARAKSICLQCPVRRACLAWSISHGMAFGIWGGTTEDERSAIRRALRQESVS
jgi:WhiB family transcriptional regulator, redox-sensing transcriptional regulator